MFYTGRRIGGEEAVAVGAWPMRWRRIADVRKEAHQAGSRKSPRAAPLAVACRPVRPMRRGFADAAPRAATERELTEQEWTRKTEDFKEGVKSYAEKRPGNWKNR